MADFGSNSAYLFDFFEEADIYFTGEYPNHVSVNLGEQFLFDLSDSNKNKFLWVEDEWVPLS